MWQSHKYLLASWGPTQVKPGPCLEEKKSHNKIDRDSLCLQFFWCWDQPMRFCWHAVNLIHFQSLLLIKSFVAIFRMFVLLNLRPIHIKNMDIWFWFVYNHSSEWKSTEGISYWVSLQQGSQVLYNRFLVSVLCLKDSWIFEESHD